VLRLLVAFALWLVTIISYSSQPMVLSKELNNDVFKGENLSSMSLTPIDDKLIIVTPWTGPGTNPSPGLCYQYPQLCSNNKLDSTIKKLTR